MYGLRQAPHTWNSKIDSYLVNLGFEKSSNEAKLYVLNHKDQAQVIISLYVDDLLIIGCDIKQLTDSNLR